MPQLSFKIQADYEKVIRLREEISKLKQELNGVNAIQNPTAFNALNSKMQELTKELNAVINKFAEADTKILETAKRIDKAVSSITSAQEKASNSASAQTEIGTNKTHTQSIEKQAKAYSSLKDEIDAVLSKRKLNIEGLLQEERAITLAKESIKNVKSHIGNGAPSDTQVILLTHYNQELIKHKQRLAEIRQELVNNAKLDIAAAGSMNQLSQSLSRMRAVYRALSEEERNSSFGKELLASIKEADMKIKELDATIGNHQRNVGNYQAYNGLNMSVQQLVRELPAARMGVNMFFMAISNNIPIMVDEIKRAKLANEELKASGQSSIPIWKQLASSLFSWQTAMMVGITLLTIYGKDIIEWGKKLISANNAQEQARKEAEAFAKTIQKSNEEWRNSVAKAASQQITEYKKLQDEWNRLGNNLNAKKKFVDANKTAFHQLGFAVNGVSDAEKVLTGNTNAVVQSIMARAKASAYYAQIQEATEKFIKQTDYNKSTVKGGGYWHVARAGDMLGQYDGKDAEKKMSERGFNKNDYKLKWAGGQSGWVNVIATASGAAKQTKMNAEKAAKILEENQKKAKDELDKRLKLLNEGLNSTTEENQSALKAIGVSEYKGNEDTKNGHNKEVDYDKMKREQTDAERELRNKTTQAGIDALADGYEKEKRQRELNHKKELEDLERYKRDFLQKKIDDARDVYKSKHGGTDKGFKPSSIGLSEEEKTNFSTIEEKLKAKHKNEDDDASKSNERALNEYLKEYGTYEEKRLAISKLYAEKIQKAKNEGEKKSLEKQKQGEYNDLDLKELKKNINWEFVFGNLDSIDIGTASVVKDQLEQFIEMSKNLEPDQIKAVVDAISQLQEKMDLSHPIESIKKARTEYATAKIEYDKYKNALASAKESGDKAGEKKAANMMLKSSQKMIKAKNKEKKAFKSVTSVIDEYASALKDAGEAIGGAAGECISLAASALSAGVSMAQGIQAFGEAASNMERAVAILAIIQAALKAIQVIMKIFGDSEDSSLATYVETMDTYIKLLDDSIKGVNDRIKDTKNSIKDTTEYYQQLITLQTESAKAIKSQSQTWLNSGASKGFLGIGSKSSEGVKIVEQMKGILSSGNDEVRKFAENGFNLLNQYFRKVTGRLANSASDFGRLDWIWKMSDEDLAKLSKDVGAMTLLGDKLSSAVKEYVEKTNAVTDALNSKFEAILDISFDSFYDEFRSMISEMDNDSETFSNNFAEYMRNALIKNLVASKYKEDLERLYKKAGEYTQNKVLDKHIAELKAEYQKIASNARNEVNNIDSITGYGEQEAQKATINEAQELTEDTGRQLVGRLTAMQISVEQGNIKRDMANAQLSLMTSTMEDLKLVQVQTRDIANETRDILSNSYLELKEISRNTEETASHLKEVKSDIRDLKRIIKDNQ